MNVLLKMWISGAAWDMRSRNAWHSLLTLDTSLEMYGQHKLPKSAQHNRRESLVPSGSNISITNWNTACTDCQIQHNAPNVNEFLRSQSKYNDIQQVCIISRDDIDDGEEDNIIIGLFMLRFALLNMHSIFVNELVAL